MRLRTLDGERVKGELTTEYPLSPDGLPVLLVRGEPVNQDDDEFFLESATRAELEMLEENGYNLPRWEKHQGSGEFMSEESLGDEYGDDESVEEEANGD